MTGLELLKAPETTAGEIADIISRQCPPEIPISCDGVKCRDCWLAWLAGVETAEETEPPSNQAAPCEGCPLQGKKREVIQLGGLLKEIDTYLSEDSHDHTSQSQ